MYYLCQDSRTNRRARWTVKGFPAATVVLAQSGIDMAFLPDAAARQASLGLRLCNQRESDTRRAGIERGIASRSGGWRESPESGEVGCG
jgi:hypothetical protein